MGLIEILLDKDRIARALVPSQNEFGVAFGNFNEYFSSNSGWLRWGTTYLRSVLLFIPSWLYPGEKPLQVVYEFRSIYFPSEISRGATAGTGFSFLLEAYMNFGAIGILIVYFIVGTVFAGLENLRRTKWNRPMFIAMYLSVVSVIPTFQRNAFGDIFSNLVLYVLIAFLVGYRGIVRLYETI